MAGLDADRIGRAFGEAADRRRESRERLAADAGRPPGPGDVYRFDGPVERAPGWWVVVAADPGDPGRLFAVPADQGVRTARTDVRVPGRGLGAELILRPAGGVWLAASQFAYGERAEVLPPAALDRLPAAARTPDPVAPPAPDVPAGRLLAYLALRQSPRVATLRPADFRPAESERPAAPDAADLVPALAALADDPAGRLRDDLGKPPPPDGMAAVPTWLPGRLLAVRSGAGCGLRYVPARGEGPPVVAAALGGWVRTPERAYDWTPAVPWEDNRVRFAIGPHAALVVVIER